mgnify:FL=1
MPLPITMMVWSWLPSLEEACRQETAVHPVAETRRAKAARAAKEACVLFILRAC